MTGPVTLRYLVTITRQTKGRPAVNAATIAYALTGRTVAANPDKDVVHVLDVTEAKLNPEIFKSEPR